MLHLYQMIIFFDKKLDNIHQRDKIATYFVSINSERVWVH